MPTKRTHVIALILGLATLGALLGSAVRDVWTIDPDAAAYVTLGRSLAAGDGYVLDGLPHGKYPPGLPMLVAALVPLAGAEGYASFHVALTVLLLVAAGASFVLARQLGHGPLLALVVAAAVGTSLTLFDLSVRYLRTEILFLAMSLAALLLARRALTTGGRGWQALLAGLAMAATMATRLAGVTLLVVPAWHLLRPADPEGGRRRAALLLVLGLAFPAAWVVRGQQIGAEFPDAPDYGAELLAAAPRDLTKTVPEDLPRVDAAGMVQRVVGNLAVFARACGVLLTNVDNTGQILAAGAALAALVLLGLLRMLAAGGARRDASLYVLATLALYLIWPFNQQERFYVPLLPWLLLAGGEGLAWAWNIARRLTEGRTGKLAVVGGLALVTVALALRRSNAPTLLGRWSPSYAAVLAALALATLAAALWLRRRELPALRTGHALLLPLLFVGPFLHERFVAWPEQVKEHIAHRQAAPVDGPLASIHVNVLLEELALHLVANTPPDAVLMTDVPKIMAILTGRRCVPFRYRREPPSVTTDDADYVFYTREIPDVAAIMDACADRFDVALRLTPVWDGTREVEPVLYAVRPGDG